MSPPEVDKWLETVTGELSRDAVGLWQVRKAAIDFALDGDQLREFLHLAVTALLNAGAIPIVGAGDGWKADDSYGSDAETIVENLLRTWGTPNSTVPDFGDVWFGRPNVMLVLH